MVVHWEVQEPPPNLYLTIDKIEPSYLTYDDIAWILSSSMKKYKEEFIELPGFIEHANYLMNQEKKRKELEKKEKENSYKCIVENYKSFVPRAPVPRVAVPRVAESKVSTPMTILSAPIEPPLVTKIYSYENRPSENTSFVSKLTHKIPFLKKPPRIIDTSY